jgi:hypothetical protein
MRDAYEVERPLHDDRAKREYSIGFRFPSPRPHMHRYLSSQQNQRADFHRTYRSEHAGQPIEAKNRLAKEQLEGLQVLGGHLGEMRTTVAVEKSDRPDADADGGENA